MSQSCWSLSLSFTPQFLWWQPTLQIWQRFSNSWNNSCIAHVKACMTNNQLQLMIKLKWFWLLQIRFPTVTRFHSPWTWMVLTSNMPTQFVTQVSVLILLSLSEKHISSIYRISCMKIRQISAMCWTDQRRPPQNYCVLFVFSRLDYCSSRLACCPKYLLSKLQTLQNNATRLIFRTTRSAHVTNIHHALHWLPNEQRINCNLSLL